MAPIVLGQGSVPTEDLVLGGALLAVFLLVIRRRVRAEPDQERPGWGARTAAGPSPPAPAPASYGARAARTGTNRFTLRATGLSGGTDWRVLARGGELQVESADPTLSARLAEAGVVRGVTNLGLPTDLPLPLVRFVAAEGYLELQEDAGPGPVPTAERFQALLAGLVWLADVNDHLNPSR